MRYTSCPISMETERRRASKRCLLDVERDAITPCYERIPAHRRPWRCPANAADISVVHAHATTPAAAMTHALGALLAPAGTFALHHRAAHALAVLAKFLPLLISQDVSDLGHMPDMAKLQLFPGLEYRIDPFLDLL